MNIVPSGSLRSESGSSSPSIDLEEPFSTPPASPGNVSNNSVNSSDCSVDYDSCSPVPDSDTELQGESSFLDHQTDNVFTSDCSMEYNIPEELFQPLYDGSKISVCGAYFSIMHFANRNKLTFSAIGDLLELLHMFCPEPNQVPNSFYKFKKFFEQFGGDYEKSDYCMECNTTIQNRSCSTRNCHRSSSEGHLVHISINKFLQAILLSEYNEKVYACIELTCLFVYIFL